MRLALSLPADVSVALSRFAKEEGLELETAAGVALAEWLLAQGYLELANELDEDTPTEGTA